MPLRNLRIETTYKSPTFWSADAKIGHRVSPFQVVGRKKNLSPRTPSELCLGDDERRCVDAGVFGALF